MVYLFQNISLYTRGMEIRTSQRTPAAEPTAAESTTGPPRRVVLDTNAVLDWLLFDGPAVQPMKAAASQGRLLPITNDACFAELERVLPNLRQRLIIDGAGHWVQQERPAEVNAALIAFLRG